LSHSRGERQPQLAIRAKAPLRLSFAGGGTDVSPYADERGGCVLNATIDKYAFGSLLPHSRGKLTVTSLDFDVVAEYEVDKQLVYNGELDLVKAVVNAFRKDSGSGFELFIHCDAPPGSGLGSSSALVTTQIGLFKELRQIPLTDYEVAELAYRIEREDVGIRGGRQDQYAAAFGGFNFIEFRGRSVIVNPLRIKPEIVNELEYNLLLCYVGGTRPSGIIDAQVDGYRRKRPESVEAMDGLKQIAIEMKENLLRGELREFGHLLHDGWEAKKRMAAAITSSRIDEIYEAALKAGALGGKLTGAGGGGYAVFYCDFKRKHQVAEALERFGAKVVQFSFVDRGLQTWRSDG
jgi:D-glycero-alpha-D-manno-heptose-7-phosphate kinase